MHCSVTRSQILFAPPSTATLRLPSRPRAREGEREIEWIISNQFAVFDYGFDYFILLNYLYISFCFNLFDYFPRGVNTTVSGSKTDFQISSTQIHRL